MYFNFVQINCNNIRLILTNKGNAILNKPFNNKTVLWTYHDN